MHRAASTESFSLAQFNNRKNSAKKRTRTSRRSSLGDYSWPPLPKQTEKPSNSHDKPNPKLLSRRASAEFLTPGARTGGKKKLNLNAPMSAHPTMNSHVSPITPRRSRTSEKLKLLWPALDPLYVFQEKEPEEIPAKSPARRRVSTPFHSPTGKPVVNKRVSDNTLQDLGKSLLSASGKKRTLKGIWPPLNFSAKQESEKQKEQPADDVPPTGNTETRKIMLRRNSTCGSSDGGNVLSPIPSPHKRISAPSLIAVSSNDEENETTFEQLSSAPREIVSEDLDLESLVVASEVGENEADENHQSKHLHSWELWADQPQKPDFDSPLLSPTHGPMPLRAKTDVRAIPSAPDLSLSPHNRNRTDVNDSEIECTTTIDESFLTPQHDIAAVSDIEYPPADLSPEESVEIEKYYPELQAAESQEQNSDVMEGSPLIPLEEDVPPSEEAPLIPAQLDAALSENDTLSIPLVPQIEDFENVLPEDDVSDYSYELGDIYDARSIKDKDEDSSTDAEPTSPTVDAEDSMASSESDGEEIVVPDRTKLPPKTQIIGRRKRTEYRIRWDGPTTLDLSVYYPLISIPEVEDLPERDERFERSKTDPGITMPVRPRRSLDGETVSLDSLFSGDKSFDSDEKSQHSSSSHSRPTIHMTPVEDDGEDLKDSQWKLKRVWDLEEMDEKEQERTVQRAEVMPSVKELCGVPENINLNDGTNTNPWVIQRVNFVDDKEVEFEEEEAFTSDEMMKEIETITSKKEGSSHKANTKRKHSESVKAAGKGATKPKKVENSGKRKSGKKDRKKTGLDSSEHSATKKDRKKTALDSSEHSATKKDQKKAALDSSEHSATKNDRKKTALDSSEHSATKKDRKKTALDSSEHSATKKGKKKSHKKKEKPAKRKSSLTEEELEGNSQEIPKALPPLILPNGQKLPPTKRKKRRRTNYQLRYDGPTLLRPSELFSIPEEEDDRFNQTDVDRSMAPRPVRRGSHPRNAFESLEDHDEIPERPSRAESNDSLGDEAQLMDTNENQISNHEVPDARAVKRPQLLMTPTKAKAPDKLKWIIRRFWDVEEYDEKEEDHSVLDQDLSSKVRELFGIPSDVALDQLTSESRFGDSSSPGDMSPFLLRRIHDIDGEIEEVEIGVEFDMKYLGRAIDHLKAEAKEMVMWWEEVADSEPKKTPVFKSLVRKVKEDTWYSQNVDDEEKPTRVLPWHKRATPNKAEQHDNVKMWWDL